MLFYMLLFMCAICVVQFAMNYSQGTEIAELKRYIRARSAQETIPDEMKKKTVYQAYFRAPQGIND